MDVDADPFHLKLFARTPVYDLVFSCLEPRSLARVALSCRAAYLAVAAFRSRAFNINRHFSRYFTDPVAFRSLQAKTSTLVSGSNALQFLDRSFYPGADLDIYTHPGHSLEVATFLVEAEGYRFAPSRNQEQDFVAAIGDAFDGTARRVRRMAGSEHTYPMTEINAVWTFRKTGRNQESLKIQIIEGISSPLEVILGFHSTCVMNLITSDAAYSLYPASTFEERSSLGMPAARHSVEAMKKYVERGWRIYFMPISNETAKSPFYLDKIRWVGDNHTWILPLDQTGVKKRPPLSPASAPLTFDPVLCNGWRLTHHKGPPDKGYFCHYYPLQTTVFRYNYAVPDEELSFVIREWATQQGKFSHYRLTKANWVWFDADIPTWRKS